AMPTNLRRERDISASHTTMPRPSATISHMAITPTPESVALRASTMAPSKIGWTPITRRAMVPMVRADAMFARLSAGAWKFGRSTCIRPPASGLPRSQTRSHRRSVREAARYPNCDRDLHLFGPADVYFLFRKRRQRRNFPFQHPIGQWFRQDSSQPDQPAHDQRKHIVGTFAAQGKENMVDSAVLRDGERRRHAIIGGSFGGDKAGINRNELDAILAELDPASVDQEPCGAFRGGIGPLQRDSQKTGERIGLRHHAAALPDHLAEDREQIIHHYVIIRTHVGRYLMRAHLAHIQSGSTACIKQHQIDTSIALDTRRNHRRGCRLVFGIRRKGKAGTT